jgi:hypothetical protein
MKISRKMQHKVEIKIRHAMATGALPVMQRSSEAGAHARPEADKGGSAEVDQGK